MVDDLTIQANKEKNFKLAKVTQLSGNGTALVTFYGEADQSQKGYSYLSTYFPVLQDTVLMMPFGDTYIITGKIQMVTDIPIELITSGKLQEALASYVTTTDAENFVTTDELGFYIQSGDTVTELIITYLTATQFSVTGPFRHKGSQLTFFNGTATTKTEVSTLSTSATLSEAISRLNTLINALKSYNLV